MKLLLSVFSCNPLHGSDAFVGWAFVKNMSMYHEVFALTRTENRDDIEMYCKDNCVDLSNIHFYYIEQSELFIKKLYKVNRYLGFLGSYYAWQRDAYKLARKLHKDYVFDICHHVSIADFRCAGYLWKLGIPYIFGPVGGGQKTPKCLREYVRGHETGEAFRSFMNQVTTLLPNYKRALHYAAKVYSSNDETSACMRRRMRVSDIHKLEQMTELCIDSAYLDARKNVQRSDNEIVRIIVSGRLIYRKGIQVLLEALIHMNTKHQFILDVYGDGDQRKKLERYVQENRLDDLVVFHGKIPYDQMQQAYLDADIYVLPSLRETTGTAVFEALANKLPVVTFDQNGAKHVVEDDAGILVALDNREQVLHDLAAALSELVDDYDARIRLGERGFQKVLEQYTWNSRAQRMCRIYDGVIKLKNM